MLYLTRGGQALVKHVIFKPNAAAANGPPKATPTPSCPKRTTRAPTHDDDDHYTVTSYGLQKQANKHTGVVQSDIMSDPKMYAKAIGSFKVVIKFPIIRKCVINEIA
jgi:hypothetical protein